MNIKLCSCPMERICFIFVIMILCGCRPIFPGQTQPGLEASKTDTPTFVVTPVIEKRETQIPVTTPTLTASPMLTFVPAAPTRVPTLDDIKRKEAIQQLITPTSQCNLPCFWGISPGTTPWDKAMPLFIKLSARFEKESKAHVSYVLTFDASKKGAVVEHVYNIFDFIEKDGLVDSIIIKGQGSERPEELQPIWQNYSPSQIISEHGTPDRVLVSSTSKFYGDKGKQGYYLWLFYDEQGFMIRYNGEIDYANTYHFCPEIGINGGIAEILIKIQSKTNLTPLEKGDEILSSIGKYRKVLTYEQATGKTLSDFYFTFIQKAKPSCFDTPRTVWTP